jgi:pimeloyl-ACP methyl ester carboxylesterase
LGPGVAAAKFECVDIVYLNRPTGRIAFSLVGEGPPVICIPGTGDARSVYRRLVSTLAGAGFREAPMDLRGHGESDVTFGTCDDAAAGSDIVVLAEHLGESAILVGNSMGACAACWAAAEAPALTAGIVLLGPFMRDAKANLAAKHLLRLALLRPWESAAWRAYFRKRYPTRPDATYGAHFAEAMGYLSKPGHWEAIHKITRASHEPVEARLGEVKAPTLVVMGSMDPDFPDPGAEAQWIDRQLQGKVLMVPGAGHYPQAELPELVLPVVIAFVQQVSAAVSSFVDRSQSQA